MDLPEEAKRAPSAPVWNQSFPSPDRTKVRTCRDKKLIDNLHSICRPVECTDSQVMSLIKYGKYEGRTVGVYFRAKLSYLSKIAETVTNIFALFCYGRSRLRPTCFN